MNRINKEGKKRKLSIKYIYKEDGINLEEIMKEGYLKYLRDLRIK